MTFQLFYDLSPRKFVRKADPPLRNHLEKELNKIARDPYQAYPLSGKLKGLYSYHLTYRGVTYRIVYGIYREEKAVKIVHVGTRENIYKELERLLRGKR